MTATTVACFLFFLLVCAIASWERARIQEAIRLLVLVVTGGIVITPTSTFLTDVLQRARTWMRDHLTNHEPPEDHANAENVTAGPTAGVTPDTQHPRLYRRQGYHLARIVMSILLTGCTGIFLIFAVSFGWATLSAMKLIPEGGDLPIHLTSVATYALIAAAVTFGAVLLEVTGWTRFLPPFRGRVRLVVGWVATAMLLLAIMVEVAMGGWRANQGSSTVQPVALSSPESVDSIDNQRPVIVADGPVRLASTEPKPSTWTGAAAGSTAKTFVATALPALVLASAAISATGTLWLMEYLIVFAVAIFVMPLAVLNNLLLPIWNNLVGHLIAGLNALVDLVANLGDRMLTARWRPEAPEAQAPSATDSAPSVEHPGGSPQPDISYPGSTGDGRLAGVTPHGHQPTGASGVDRNWFFLGDENPGEGARS